MKKLALMVIVIAYFSNANAKIDKNIAQFFSMLTVSNLDTTVSKLIEINGTTFTTWEMYATLKKEYYISTVDLMNLKSVRWTSKQEYDNLYPEDSSINSDAKFITLYFTKGDVIKESYFTETGTQVRKAKEGYTEKATQWPNCDFVNINFKNSSLAIQAKSYLDAYLNKNK